MSISHSAHWPSHRGLSGQCHCTHAVSLFLVSNSPIFLGFLLWFSGLSTSHVLFVALDASSHVSCSSFDNRICDVRETSFSHARSSRLRVNHHLPLQWYRSNANSRQSASDRSRMYDTHQMCLVLVQRSQRWHVPVNTVQS